MNNRTKMKLSLSITLLMVSIGVIAFNWFSSDDSNFYSPVNMQSEKIVHPILRVERNQEPTTELTANALAELNNYEGPAWIQAFKPDFATSEMTAVTKLCKMAIGLSGNKLVTIAGIPTYVAQECEVQRDDEKVRKEPASRDIVTWYCTFGLNAIPVKFVLERDKCTKAFVCDWRPCPLPPHTRVYELTKGAIHPILHLSLNSANALVQGMIPRLSRFSPTINDSANDLNQVVIPGLYRSPPSQNNDSGTHMPLKSQPGQKQVSSGLDDLIFLKLNRYVPPNTRGYWTHIFGPAETTVAIKLSVLVRGLTKDQIVSLAGPPTFRCAHIPGWKFGDQGQNIWIYLIGGSEIPVRLSFKENICNSAEIFDGKGLDQLFKWRVSEIQKFAIGKPLPKILARLEKPVDFINNREESQSAIQKILGMQSFTYSPQDTSTPVVLSFMLGRCWDVHPSSDLISR
ncbi:hypothetical protein KA344_03105 [bacterium]|jgi:hypothetical protein|nr:hypothetical protein [bacterium]